MTFDEAYEKMRELEMAGLEMMIAYKTGKRASTLTTRSRRSGAIRSSRSWGLTRGAPSNRLSR